MNRIHLMRLAAAAAVAVAAPAHATNGMRMIGFGPVQNSMGGVGVGATLDASSILTNPAGIVDLGARVDFDASYFKPTVSYSATGTAVPLPTNPFVNQPGVTIQSDRGATPIPSIGIVFPIADQWSFGIGAYGVAGMGVDYAQNLYSSTTYSAYSQMRFTPGVAYRLNDMFSFGVTLNGMWAQTEWNVANAFGQAPHMTASAFGIGGTVSAKITPIKMLTIGVAYETKSFFQDYSYNAGATGVNPATGAAVPIFAPGVDKLTFNQPGVLTGGVAVRPIEMLLVAADVSWIDWPSAVGANLPAYSQNTTGAIPWNLNWGSQVVFKVGAEIQAVDWLKIRAGYNYGKSPLDPTRAFENVCFPAIAESHFTAGLGFDVGKHVGINLGVVIAPSVTVTGSNPALPQNFPGAAAPFGQGIQSYSTTMSQYQLDGGLTYKF